MRQHPLPSVAVYRDSAAAERTAPANSWDVLDSYSSTGSEPCRRSVREPQFPIALQLLFTGKLSAHTKGRGSPRRVSPCAARGPGPCGGGRAAPSAAAGSWPCVRGSSGQPARDRARQGARARLGLPHRPAKERTHIKFHSLYMVKCHGGRSQAQGLTCARNISCSASSLLGLSGWKVKISTWDW